MRSAAGSKRREMRCIVELERKVQALQAEANSLSAQLTLLERESNDLTAEISERRLRLQTMEQQLHLQEALNDALEEAIQRIKVQIGQRLAIAGPVGSNPQFNSNNHAMHALLTAQQLQQLQMHSDQQQQQEQQSGDMESTSSGSSAQDDHSSEITSD